MDDSGDGKPKDRKNESRSHALPMKYLAKYGTLDKGCYQVEKNVGKYASSSREILFLKVNNLRLYLVVTLRKFLTRLSIILYSFSTARHIGRGSGLYAMSINDQLLYPMRLRAHILFLAFNFIVSSALLCAEGANVRVVESTGDRLTLRVTSPIARWDSLRSDNFLRLVPRVNAPSEVVIAEGLRPVVAPAVRELISVPGERDWRVESCVLYCRLVRPDGTFETFTVSGTGTPNKGVWNLADDRCSVPYVRLSYLGQSGSQHLVRFISVCEQPSKNSGSRIVCDSVLMTLTFTPMLGSVEGTFTGSDRFPAVSKNTLNDHAVRLWNKSLGAEGKSSGVRLQTSKKRSVASDSSRQSTWYKIPIKESGVYRVRAESLAKLGVRLETVKAGTVKIYGRGGSELPEAPSLSIKNRLNEIPIIVNTTSNGDVVEVIFYASAQRGFTFNAKNRRFEHRINHYDEQSYYFLTWGGTPGKRAIEATPAPAPYANTPTQFTARVFQEEELVNAYSGGSGRRWFGQQIDAVLPRTFSTKLPGLIRNGSVEYVIDVAHKEVFSPDLSAKVSVSENGAKVTDVPLIGVNEPGYAEYVSMKVRGTLPAQSVNADGNSYLRFEYANPYVSGGGNAFLDFFEIHYPAVCSAVNDELTLYSDIGAVGTTQYSIGGFSNTALLGFDVSDPQNPILLRNTSSVGNIFQFAVALDSVTGPRTYFLSAKTRTADPIPVTWTYLRDEDVSAEVIVVSADEFLSSANDFATYRAGKSGMNVRVVPMSAIVNEFGSGVGDPGAIRDFISHAYRTWTVKPKYVVLWGDGHYDYKNITTQRTSYIPSWQTIETDERFNDINIGYYTSSYVTDDFFVRIVGDDEVTDIPIGRLPIDSRAGGDAAIAKIRHYEESSSKDLWRTTATFVADDGPTSNGRSDGDLHTNQSEVLSNDTTCMPADMIQRKIYMAEYPAENIPKGKLKPRVTEDILSAVNNQGTLLLNWIGHGNPKVWAHETVLSRDVTIPQFTNYDKLFFLVAATCDFGRWDLPESQSGAELMLTSRRGGAIGAFTSSRVSFSTLNAMIGRTLFRKMFSRDVKGDYLTMGDVVNATKQLHSGENDQKFMLLGDPTLKLVLPDLVASVDSINGISTDSTTSANVKAVSTVKLAGRIRKFGSDETVRDFTGAATVSMFDADIFRRFMDPSAFSIGDSSSYDMVKFGGTLHRGNYKVDGGVFRAEFVVPKDIAFTNKNGRIFIYAQSDDNRHARGNSRAFSVGGIDTTDRADSEGPTVGLFLDNTTFLPGDIVRKNPLLIVALRDETGINSTGLGVGHKIEAWLDDSEESIDLSENYVSSLTDSRVGNATKQLFDLVPGMHTVRVRVWDVLNNYSERSTYFSVAPGDSTFVSGRVVVYPNPFETQTTVLFTHNQSFPLSIVAKVYSVNGVLVREESMTSTSLQSARFVWDGQDASGNELPSGVYPVVLHITTASGNLSTITALAVLSR